MVDFLVGIRSGTRLWAGTTSCGRGNRIIGADDMRFQHVLWKISWVQRYDEVGISFLRADAEGFIERIGRNVAPFSRRYLFSCPANKADGRSNKVRSHLAAPKNGLILVEDILIHQPGESAGVDPFAQHPCTGNKGAVSVGFECGDPRDEYRGIDDASRPFFSLVRQLQ